MDEQLELAILAGASDEDIEELILHNVVGVENSSTPIEPVFDFDNIIDEQFYVNNFRFTKNDLRRLRNVLRIPQKIVTETRNTVDGQLALCILLKRLSYPNRLIDLEGFFNYKSQSLSQIITATANFIVENHGHLLDNLSAHQWLDRNRYQLYAQSIRNMGGAVPNCWGFIDGTVRQICRPSIHQEDYYSGHKRVHCVKYQSILCPDGIIINLKGAFPGRRHDSGILRETNIYNQLEQNCIFSNNENYVIYGDQAYGVKQLLLSPFSGQPANLLEHEIAFNNSMKVLRVAVEWGFQKLVTQFAFLDFKKNQKLLLTDIEALYKCAVILVNCHTCLNGSQSSIYFNVTPPVLEDYIG